MRVNGTYGLEPRKPAKARPAAGAGAADSLATGATERVSSQERLIASAIAVDEVNLRAVEEAQALLASGELDSPQAARRAAEAILDAGL